MYLRFPRKDLPEYSNLPKLQAVEVEKSVIFDHLVSHFPVNWDLLQGKSFLLKQAQYVKVVLSRQNFYIWFLSGDMSYYVESCQKMGYFWTIFYINAHISTQKPNIKILSA